MVNGILISTASQQGVRGFFYGALRLLFFATKARRHEETKYDLYLVARGLQHKAKMLPDNKPII
jgi:hypothetical protein